MREVGLTYKFLQCTAEVAGVVFPDGKRCRVSDGVRVFIVQERAGRNGGVNIRGRGGVCGIVCAF